jgi:hypothetical protein
LNDVVIRLVGGMGNQMFQYAAARAVALRCGSGLSLDLSWFGTVSDRRYALSPFGIHARLLGKTATNALPIRYWKRLARRLIGRVDDRWRGLPVFREKHFHFDPAVLNISEPVYLEGYYQSEKYFADFRGIIASDFRVIDPPSVAAHKMLEIIASHDAICLHVRRGDYVTNSKANAFHGLCPLEYYRKGLQIVSDGLADPHCFVFSDDPEWVRMNLKINLPVTLVDIHGPERAHDDLRLMASCKHFVIANSSLSWWGAWLGDSPGKRVVAPLEWFRNTGNDTKDLIPGSWTRI